MKKRIGTLTCIVPNGKTKKKELTQKHENAVEDQKRGFGRFGARKGQLGVSAIVNSARIDVVVSVYHRTVH